MRLALETASDRASVALGGGSAATFEREVTGSRRHAAALLPMMSAVLREAGATLDDVTELVLSDGPGSFTGLRVGAAVAKALVQARGLPLWTVPSLLVRAAGVGRAGTTVLAVSDALRGELYAAAYRFEEGSTSRTVVEVLKPSVYGTDALVGGTPRPDLLVGEAPEPLRRALEHWAGSELVSPPAGAPHARTMLGLVGIAGGAARVEAVQGWEPTYGRPAEAQARWETAHGRPLPDSIGSRG
ncbi:MAG TPA: tRNA (adenosine(37)-N6)-threonylcarbamoyltransferase complex dimerization subunit type 1 TsaB [Gemmatimonadales bacterium]|nr:tRNA (adenosine(37)-N6)-threonylcarbamoyltransferase complex dimerization subunit type 1 TsaB [Gemmatimonadales bacterium]